MSASTFGINIDDLRQQSETVKDAERNRHTLIENLIQHIETLSHDQQENVKALRAKEILATAYQDRFEAAEKQINKLQRAIDCDMFVLVVIDGDDTLFKDDYIRDGVQGGERAARDLQQTLLEYFKNKQYFKHDYKIVTKIYLNLMGLSRTYHDVKITSMATALSQFVQGFNKTHELMEIVDAGDGKEAADNKVKAEFDLFRRNLQCKQILLAGSGDNSYAGFLSKYAPSSGKSETITLIRALPFARELQSVSEKFDTVSFDDVFRTTKIITRRVSFHEGVSRVRTPSVTATSAPEPPATPPTTYATKAYSAATVSVTNNTNGISTGDHKEFIPVSTAKSSRTIYRNSLGQRVDKPIMNLDKDLAYKLKQRKLCNKYYISKNCSFGDFCLHDHKSALTGVELDNLRYVARQKPCDRGLDCDDPDCYNGHRCQYGTRCTNWMNQDCWFSDEMHQVDITNPRSVAVRV